MEVDRRAVGVLWERERSHSEARMHALKVRLEKFITFYILFLILKKSKKLCRLDNIQQNKTDNPKKKNIYRSTHANAE